MLTKNGNSLENVNESKNNKHMSTVDKKYANRSELQHISAPSAGLSDWTIPHIHLIKLSANIENKPTRIDEKSPAVLKYRTPHFEARANVEIPPLQNNSTVQIGWIQTCTHMIFLNTYDNIGVTSWEFPELESEKRRIATEKSRSIPMISDSDGKNYPWYGAKTEMKIIQGPTTNPTQVNVTMDDNFFPNVTWYIPEPSWGKTPRLRHIYRKQHFLTSLALKINSRIHIIKTIAWHMEIEIDVNPDKRKGWLVGRHIQHQPELLPEAVKIPASALNAPNANNCQTLIWRPFRPELGSPKIIVPPKDSRVSIERYMSDSNDRVKHFHRELPPHHPLHEFVQHT